MTIKDFLESPEFELFKDEKLRKQATHAVNSILHRSTKPISRHQLHSILNVIQGAETHKESAAIRELAAKQKEKNTNRTNKAFWTEIDDILSATPSALLNTGRNNRDSISLFESLKNVLSEQNLLKNEDPTFDEETLERVKKNNNDRVEILMNKVISTYFEHFTCHYYYKTQGGL